MQVTDRRDIPSAGEDAFEKDGVGRDISKTQRKKKKKISLCFAGSASSW
jgi:hypothetical protein